MKQINYNEIVSDELLIGNLDHNEYIGFLEDYRVLHCLLRKYNPKSIFEIGTNIGMGVNVIYHSIPNATICSLDLDYETMCKNSKQYPLEENGNDRVGSAAIIDYIQLRGDSMLFDYSKYPCESYFIDGEHDFSHPNHEAKEIIKLNPKLIIFHDADMPQVRSAILDAFDKNKDYELYFVTNTRIAYATRKNI